MSQHPAWNDSYVGTPPPWDIGAPQTAFTALADAGALHGDVLDSGCGTGEHTLLAAAHGARATGVDIAERAIEIARHKSDERGINATFEVGDVLHLERLGRQFDVVIDSGVFHVFDDEERATYVSSLRSALRPGGMLYVACFSEDQPGDWGPRRVSQAELRAAFSDGWSIASVQPATFAISVDPDGARAWLATIERIGEPAGAQPA